VQTDIQVIKDILKGRIFKKVGNGATTVVVGDTQGDLVLKVPLRAVSLKPEERNFIDNNRLLKKIDIFIKVYMPKKFTIYIKQKLKVMYYKFKGMKADVNKIVLEQLEDGHDIAEKRNFKNVLKFRLIPNISKELRIKGVGKSNLLNGNIPSLIVSEQLDKSNIFYNKVKNEVSKGNIDKVFQMCDAVFKAQLELGQEGGYDLDVGINILENWAITEINEYKLVDVGALSEDREEAYEFFSLKIAQAAEVLKLMESLTLKETIKVLEMRGNNLAHNLEKFKELFSNHEMAKMFAIHFCKNIIKYCDPEYIQALKLVDNSKVNSKNKVSLRSLPEVILPGIKLFHFGSDDQRLMQMSI